MFLKIGELKRIMKDALKSSGLIVGNTGEWFLVYTEKWGVATELQYLSNKFKAAVIELIGDLPEEGEAYLYTSMSMGLSGRRIWTRWIRTMNGWLRRMWQLKPA